ncbi:MAG: hypothetical protein RL338_494 [Chloroflexota bacterium]
MTAAAPAPTGATRHGGRTLLRAWLGASGAAAVACAVAGGFLAGALGTDPTFQPLTPGPIAFFTFLFGAVATVVYGRVAVGPDARRRWLRVAAIAALVSLAPDVMLIVAPGAAPIPGASPEAGVALGILHLLAAPIIAFGLLRLAPPRP